jgi:hypothetical protein
MAKVQAYLERACPGEIESVYCEPNSAGLAVIVKGETDGNFLLRDLRERTDGEKLRHLAGELGLDSGAVDATIALGASFEQARAELIQQAADQLRTRSDIPDLLTVERLLELKLLKPRAYIERLLHEGETVAVAGRPKVGKSRAAMQMALALVNGESFLGCAVPKAATVLMIDFENRFAALSERFRLMNGNTDGYKRLHIWSAKSLSSDLPNGSDPGKERLRALVENVRPDVLIIDPWRLFLPGNENDAVDVVRGLRILAALREHNLEHLAIVIVHHLRKDRSDNPETLLDDPYMWSESLSGHHALLSHVDACLGLERRDELIVFGGISRNADPPRLVLEEDDSLRFTVAGNEEAASKVMTPAQAAIWAVARTMGSFTFTELVSKANAKSKGVVTKALRTAESHGLLTHSGDGKKGDHYIINPLGG